jgi:hypothetical protein
MRTKMRQVSRDLLLLLLAAPVGLLFDLYFGTKIGYCEPKSDNASISMKPEPNQRFALVIGNRAYSKPLRTPLKDSEGVANALRDLGFQVQEERDVPTRAYLEDVIRSFGARIKEKSTALFYYAGHALQVNGINYLVPIRANIETLQSVIDESVNVDIVYDLMETRQNIIILDACRDNPFLREGWAQGLAFPGPRAPREAIIAYSTEPNNRASDDPIGVYSRYTRALIKYIRQPGLRIEDCFKLIKSYVSANTDGAQTPWIASSFGAQNSEAYFRDPVYITGQIGRGDDEVLVLINGEPVMVWSVDGTNNKKILLRAGQNDLRILVYNQRTFKEIWRLTPEGWSYQVRFLKDDQELLKLTDMEDVPSKDGPRHGRTFTVATARISVDETTGNIEFKDVDGSIWRRQ